MITLEDVIIKLQQVDSLMYTVETELLGLEMEWDDGSKRVTDLFYIAWDLLRRIASDAEEVAGHVEVCNAIFAVNRVKEMQRELSELKKKANFGNNLHTDAH